MAFRPISTLVALGVVMAATLSLTPSAAQTVTFADSNLDAAVRQAISKSSGPIDVSDLQGLTELQATDCQIVDLSGIQFCTDLERLWLGGNQIVGLQPLSGLTGLRHLYLWDNRISSLEPLSELVNLTVLDLAYNRISALQPLTSLHSLVELGLEHNTISDVQPLAALIGLQMLGLNFNAITNLQPLSGLTNLSYLSVWSNQVADLQPISGLSGLTFLDISANSIIDLQPLASLQALQYLYAMDNYITDPSPLTWLHNLSQVDLAHNMLTDLTALVSNPGLSTDDIVILNENWLVLGEDTQAGIAIQTLRDRGVKVWCDNQLAPQPPPAPIALMATIDVTGHVALNWTDTSIGEQGFQLQRRIRNADGTWPQLWTVIATLPADSQHHLDNSLTNKGTYQYRVQSFNIVGSSYWATSQGLTVTPPTPVAPSHIAVWAVEGDTELTVTWQDNSSNETSFKIERRRWLPDGAWSAWELRLWTAPNFTAFTDREIPIGSSYQYRVRAVNSVGPSEWAVSTGVRCEPTSLWPVSLSASQSDPTDGVQLTWRDKSNCETGFEVHRRRQMDGTTWGDWEAVGWPSANTEQWDDLTIPQHGVYEYRIRAVNDHGASEWSPSTALWALPRPPEAPSNVTVQSVEDSTAIRITWQDNSDNETSFRLQRRRWLPTETWSEWEDRLWTAPDYVVFTDRQLPCGSSYQYRVRAANAHGFSDWAVSPGVRCEPTPLWPVDLRVQVHNGGADIFLTWRSRSEKAMYLKVERRRQLGKVDVWSDWQTFVWLGGKVTQYLDSSIPGNGKYQYRVRVFNQTGPSEYSLPLTVWRLATGPASLSVKTMTVQQTQRQLSVAYTLNSSAQVTIEIRNMAGRLIAALDCGQVSQGTHLASWNLCNSAGAPVPAGQYTCTLTARSGDGSQASAIASAMVQR